MSPEFFSFFKQLEEYNTREWFKANKSRFDSCVKEPFENFIQDLIQKIQKVDSDFSELTSKECIFRIHRDIRFSKDKSPYKLHMSALISPLGKKGMTEKGFYLEVGLDNIRLYTGLYQPSRESIESVRKEIQFSHNDFKKIYENKEFKACFGKILGDKNKRLSKEFMDFSSTEPLILNKQWYVFKDFSRNESYKANFCEKLIEFYIISLPFQQFLQKHKS